MKMKITMTDVSLKTYYRIESHYLYYSTFNHLKHFSSTVYIFLRLGIACEWHSLIDVEEYNDRTVVDVLTDIIIRARNIWNLNTCMLINLIFLSLHFKFASDAQS